MKNILSIYFACVISILNTAIAKETFTGPYAGLSAGASILTGKEKSNLGKEIGLGGANNLFANSHRITDMGFAPGIFAGYSKRLNNNFWTGIELSYSYDRLKGFANNKLNKVNTSGAFGRYLHLGFLFRNNFSLYGIAGFESRSFKFAAQYPNISTLVKGSYRSLAFTPGLGMRFDLNDDWFIKTEYKCAMHSSKKFRSSSSSATVPGTQNTATTRYKPQVHSFNVGIAFKF